jgi:hypothetical protein
MNIASFSDCQNFRIKNWGDALSTFTPEFPQLCFPTYEDSPDKDQNCILPNEHLYHSGVTLMSRQFSGQGDVSP